MNIDKFICIVYDPKNMIYLSMQPDSISMNGVDGSVSYQLSGTILSGTIQLDPTTMLKIAEYNTNKELELTNAKLKVAQLELQGFKDKIKRFKNKYEEIIQFIDNDFTMDDE